MQKKKDKFKLSCLYFQAKRILTNKNLNDIKEFLQTIYTAAFVCSVTVIGAKM